jgi:hypothetical protein
MTFSLVRYDATVRLRLGRRPTFSKSNPKIDRPSEPVKNVLFLRHHR